MAIKATSLTTETVGSASGPGRYATHFEQFIEPGSSARIHIGQVVDVCQQRQLHLVRCAGCQFFCSVATATANPYYGARDSVLFPVASFVVVITSKDMSLNRGVIIGGYPPASASLKEKGQISFTLAAELVPGSPVGPFKDKISAETFKQILAVDPTLNKNSGRPTDAYPGDITQITELGCGFWAGRTAAVLRAGHDVGVECHYVDSLLRLTGFNFEQLTSGSDTTSFNDEGDFTEITRLSPYVIESMGGTDPVEGLIPSKKGEDRKDSKTGTASHVPKEAEQTGYWRYLRLTGYLGDVDSTYITTISEAAQAPRKGGEDFDAKVQDYHGVFKQTTGVDGAYTVQSAKSIALVKDIMIPVPQEIFRPDDPRGDNDEGGFKKYQLERKDIEFEEDTAYSRALSTHDIIARQSNYTSNLPIQEHSATEGGKDWDLKEISELKFGGETGTSWQDINTINRGKFWADLPKIANIKVDHRTETSKYFVSKSCIVMHEDGSIHLEDGYGGQISMKGGNIDISCPGTISMRPGNDMVSLAGRSISNIAGENVEVAAMKGDVRLHADRNVTILGGNDGRGGVLVESKASTYHMLPAETLGLEDPVGNNNSYGGVWLKSTLGAVSMLGKTAHIGCGTNGEITIDGNEGGVVNVVGDRITTISKSLYFAIGEPGNLGAGCHVGFNENGTATVAINSSFNLLANNLTATGSSPGTYMNILLAGTLVAQNSVLAKTIIDGFDIGANGREAFKKSREEFEETLQEFADLLDDFLAKLEESILRKPDELMLITFTYPTTEERGLPIAEESAPILTEATWQTRYRSGGIGKKFKFTGVDPSTDRGSSPEVSSSITSPWPGAAAFETAYSEVDFKFIDMKTGGAVDRVGGTKYKESIPKAEPTPLKQYLINTENKAPGSLTYLKAKTNV